MTLPARMPSTAKSTTTGSSVSGPKVQTIDCSGRTQRSDPGSADGLPQRIDFGQGKARITAGTNSAMTSSAARPGFTT